MTIEPRLVTPQGQMIVLTSQQYQQVLKTLAISATPVARPSRTEVRALLAEVTGKYRGKISLTQALLAERRQEREREEAKIRRYAHRA
jgi:hypothetical protein